MICTSILDIRNMIELHKILGKENSFTISIATIKYVKRNSEEEDYYTKDMVLDNKSETLPELEQSNRLDIFNFYKNKLTNSVNRKMVSSIVKTHIKNDVIHQIKTFMEDYYTDRIDVINLSKQNEDFKHIINTFKLNYIIDDDKIIDKIDSIVKNTLDNEKLKVVLPLIYVEKFNIVSNSLPSINNERLEKGETLLLKDKTMLGIDDKFNIKADTILVDKDSNRLLFLDKIKDGTISVRKITEEELFTTFVFNH